MLAVGEAFSKFIGRLELSKQEQGDVSRRQKEVREHMRQEFDVEHDFLTGSYARWTKTKPLRDVDIFCVLGEDERSYRDQHPSNLLGDVRDHLAAKYGRDSVAKQRRSVSVQFGVTADENEETGGRVMSLDVVPAFPKADHYEIPDEATASLWTETDPRVHADKAVKAHADYSKAWKPIVRMLKKWNEHNGKPVKPSFLIEVMALDLLYPPFGGDYRYELKSVFATLADHLDRDWPDPAGLGPPVSDSMTAADIVAAQQRLRMASEAASAAIRHEQVGRNGKALRVWRDDLFGPLFPLS